MKVRCRGGFIGEFGAGGGTAETKERLGSPEGTGEGSRRQQVLSELRTPGPGE